MIEIKTYDSTTQARTAAAVEHLVDACHGASVRAGWWHHAPTGRCLSDVIAAPCTDEEKLLAGALYGQKLALAHSELSESLEGHRKGLMDEHLPHRKSAEVELADAMIRIADLAGAMQFDLGAAVAEKLAYNAQRADHKPDARAAAGGKAY